MTAYLRSSALLIVCMLCAGKKNEAQTRQANDEVLPKTVDEFPKPQVLSSGFFDVMNNGQMNASARFLRLFIGEPGKLCIPLSIYSGVSANSFQNSAVMRTNDHLVNGFLNPLSGLVNASIEGKVQKKGGCRTSYACILYQLGARLLSGYQPSSYFSSSRPVNFLNSYALSGLYLQTGAWERSSARNLGFFWCSLRYIVTHSQAEQLQRLMPALKTNGLYHGYSLGWGVEINNLVNLKLIYYKYVKRPEPDYQLSLYQFSFNYSLK